MNPLDISFLVVLGAGTVYGLVKGFARIAIGTAGLAISVALALRLADRGPDWFSGVFASRQLAMLAAFVLVLVAGLVVTGLVAWLAGKLVRAAELTWADRLVGAAVGFLGGTFLLSALLVGITSLLPPGSRLVTESRVVPVVLRVMDAAATILPPRMEKAWRERREALGDLPGATRERADRGGRPAS